MRISDWSSDVCSSDLGGLTSSNGTDTGSPTKRRVEPPRSVHRVKSASARRMSTTIHRPKRKPRSPERDDRAGAVGRAGADWAAARSEEHTSETQSLMRISYAVFRIKKIHKIHSQT